VGALGTAMTGAPVARIAAGTRPATGTTTSVFVVVFPHSLWMIKERLENEIQTSLHSWGRLVLR